MIPLKINEVAALVGITKKNIRFYEEKGLLSPSRNSENGYRDYGEAEVAVLRRIKLMRKLGVPIDEIRRMQEGSQTVGDGMRRHLITLERERRNLGSRPAPPSPTNSGRTSASATWRPLWSRWCWWR